MKKLIVVRHGKSGSNDRLDETGQEQIDRLAKKLKALIMGDSVLLLTSPVDRARESAEIIGAHLNVKPGEHMILWSDYEHPEDFPGVLELVNSRRENVETLVLVTHFEYAKGFPAYFVKEELGTEPKCHQIGNGEAWVVDCEHDMSLTHMT